MITKPDCQYVQRMARHTKYDERCTLLMSQWAQFRETGIITKATHAAVRPLYRQVQAVIKDALEANDNCLTAEQLHREFDGRVGQLMDQLAELHEHDVIDEKEHSLARNIMLHFERIAHGALTENFGSSEG